jgi:hypothetical protein
MTVKQSVIQQIEAIDDLNLLQEILSFIESCKTRCKFHGRPVYTLEELKHINNDLPLEPEWEVIWNQESDNDT